MHTSLWSILSGKGYEIPDEFSYPRFNKNGFLKFINSINKGRPNDEDLKNTANFARKLIVEEKNNE